MATTMLHIFIVIGWFIFASLSLLEITPMCADLTFPKKFVIILLVSLAGPFLAITSVVEGILELLIDDWPDDKTSGFF